MPDPARGIPGPKRCIPRPAHAGNARPDPARGIPTPESVNPGFAHAGNAMPDPACGTPSPESGIPGPAHAEPLDRPNTTASFIHVRAGSIAASTVESLGSWNPLADDNTPAGSAVEADSFLLEDGGAASPGQASHHVSVEESEEE